MLCRSTLRWRQMGYFDDPLADVMFHLCADADFAGGLRAFLAAFLRDCARDSCCAPRSQDRFLSKPFWRGASLVKIWVCALGPLRHPTRRPPTRQAASSAPWRHRPTATPGRRPPPATGGRRSRTSAASGTSSVQRISRSRVCASWSEWLGFCNTVRRRICSEAGVTRLFGVVRNLARAPHPWCVCVVAVRRYDPRRRLRVLGPQEYAPSRRAIQVAPPLVRIHASCARWAQEGHPRHRFCQESVQRDATALTSDDFVVEGHSWHGL